MNEVQRTVPFPAGGRIYVRNILGNVRVTAWDRPEVKIVSVKRASTAANLAAAEVVVNNQGGELCIASWYGGSNHSLKNWFGLADQPCHDSQNLRGDPGDFVTVDYTLLVPRNAPLTILNSEGDVDVEGTAASLFIDIEKGHLTARDVSGDCKLYGSYSGVNVTLTSLTRDTHIQSAVGPLAVYLSPAVSARVTARAQRVVENDFGWQQRPRENLKGTLGDGKVLLDVSSSSGRVEIRRLQPPAPAPPVAKKTGTPAARKEAH